MFFCTYRWVFWKEKFLGSQQCTSPISTREVDTPILLQLNMPNKANKPSEEKMGLGAVQYDDRSFEGHKAGVLQIESF